jgi:hypothetical protein
MFDHATALSGRCEPMRRTVLTLAGGVAIATGTAGCGLSSSRPPAVAAPLPSAAHVLARSERAVARMRSFQVFMRIVVAHQPTTDLTDQVRDGGYQVSFHGNNLAVQTRVIGHSVYSNFHAVGNLGNTLAELGRSTGAGRWYRVPAPPEIMTLERESRPANLAGCMLGTRIGRPSLATQTTTFNGLAADVVDVHQGAAGTLRVVIAANPPVPAAAGHAHRRAQRTRAVALGQPLRPRGLRPGHP